MERQNKTNIEINIDVNVYLLFRSVHEKKKRPYSWFGRGNALLTLKVTADSISRLDSVDGRARLIIYYKLSH